MAGGAFLTSRELFKHPIWQNVVEFRLFFLIYGNAIFSDEGHRVDDTLTLQRGEWLRSTRKLQEDLEYIEDRKVKQYSTATINRAIKRLVTLQRVCTKTHELGTVFTVLNYEQYQGFGAYSNELHETASETVTKQSRNNNKNVYKGEEGLKDISESPKSKVVKKKKYAEHVSMTEHEYTKLLDQLGEQLTQSMIDRLNNYKGSTGKKYKSDYHTVLNWHRKDLEKQSLSNRTISKQDRNKEVLQRHMQDEVNDYDRQTSDPAVSSLFNSLPYNDPN